MVWETHSLSFPGGSVGQAVGFHFVVVTCQGGPGMCPCCLTVTARKALFPRVQGQRELAAQALPSVSLVRALSSLRCSACGSGPATDISCRSLAPLPAHKGDFSAPAFSQQLQGRGMNPSRDRQREENAKGPGAGTTQALLPGSLSHTQPASPGTWQRPRTRRRGSPASRMTDNPRGIPYKDIQGLYLLLWDLVSTCADTMGSSPYPPPRRPECGRWGHGVLPIMKRQMAMPWEGPGCSFGLPWFFQSRKSSSSSSGNRRPCRF